MTEKGKKRIRTTIISGVSISLILSIIYFLVNSFLTERESYGQMKQLPNKVENIETTQKYIYKRQDSICNYIKSHEEIQAVVVKNINEKLDKQGQTIDKIYDILTKKWN